MAGCDISGGVTWDEDDPACGIIKQNTWRALVSLRNSFWAVSVEPPPDEECISCTRAQRDHTLEERAAAPQIDTGHTAQKTQQLLDDLLNAMELASCVRDPSCGHIVDKIFPKYFPPSEKATVDGTSLLSVGIKMSTETDVSIPEHGRWASQLEDIYGKIHHLARVYAYSDIRRASSCERSGRWRIYMVLGRSVGLAMATNNADSYSWAANEIVWTVHCQRKHYAGPIQAVEQSLGLLLHSYVGYS
ncbi:hypothetical protein M436DRAFT_62373 [Aureobasidium namibiae CBS 147.97]|uniref:Uncharacterized protein n=1 Tax=Aureobasidium namibiae CBS 147.97 TaxID=1043004 RepID=A0A074WP88_9PEZI